MFPSRLRLFTVAGHAVWAHASWLPLGLVALWTLAEVVFPFFVPGLDRATFWAMAAAGLVTLALSLLFREAAHVFFARHWGLPWTGGTLLPFGATPEWDGEAPRPKAEALTALMGLFANFALGAAILVATAQWMGPQTHLAIVGVALWTAAANWLIVGLNLVPAYPLSAGLMLRAALWAWTRDRARAARVTRWISLAIAVLVAGFGLFLLVQAQPVAGLWAALLGLALLAAARGAPRPAAA